MPGLSASSRVFTVLVKTNKRVMKIRNNMSETVNDLYDLYEDAGTEFVNYCVVFFYEEAKGGENYRD